MSRLSLAFIVAVCCTLVASAAAMLIPEDTEILAGFEMDDIQPEGLYFELRSLTTDHRRLIRNRRNAYAVLASPGLRSHFVINQPLVTKRVLVHGAQKAATEEHDAYMQNIAYAGLRPPKRNAREVPRNAAETVSNDSVEMTTPPPAANDETPHPETMEAIDEIAHEPLPVAARLSMASADDDYAIDQNEAAGSSLMDTWHDGTYVYAKMRDDSADDVQPPPQPAQSPLVSNEGIAGRMPRVHFITQKSQPEAKDSYATSSADGEAGRGKSSRSVPEKREDRYGGGGMLRPSASTRYHSYDLYDQPFDGYDREMLLQPESYARSSFDYIPTRAPTYADYFYSERRFDLPPPPAPLPPLYRDHHTSRTVYHPDDRYLPAPSSTVDMKPPRNRRIIYYATLPEIVRSPPPPPPPSVPLDSRYRGYNSRGYDYPGGSYEYDRYYRSVRAEKPPAGTTAAASSAKDSSAARSHQLNRKQFLDGSVRIASTLTVNDAPHKSLKPTVAATAATKRPIDYGRYY